MLILVRHGQTAANAEGRLLGRADPPLTPLGRAQAEALARALPAPKRLVTSPLGRARETAAAFGLRVEVDERWIEMDYGVLEGDAVASVAASTWQRWRADPAHAPAGGESLVAVGRRVREACADLVADAAGGDVIVVTHVSPIKAAIAWALGAGDEIAWRLFVEDAAACRIATAGSTPSLRSFNETFGP